MQIRRRARRLDTETGILPLINVVFLLLIFFMLAGRLTETAPFRVTPPVSEQAGAVDDQAAMEAAAVLVAPDGRLALNGRPIEAAALKATVAAELALRPDLPVSLKADGTAEAAEVVGVMEILRDAGVRRLQLFAQSGDSTTATQVEATRPEASR